MSNPHLSLSRPVVIEAEKSASRATEELAIVLRALLDDPHWPTRIACASDLSRAGIPTKLAWQVFRAATGVDPLADSYYLPGKEGVARFLALSSKHGVSAKALDDVEAAFARFQELVLTIGGDRDSFAEIAESWRGRRTSGSVAAYCRQAYRAARHIWGVSCKSSLMTTINFPIGEPIENMLIRGFCEVRAVRTGWWDLHGVALESQEGGLVHVESVEEDETKLLAEYSSSPLPLLRVRSNDTVRMVGAHFEAAGELELHSLIFREACRGYAGMQQRRDHLYVALPTETVTMDVIVHQDLHPKLNGHSLTAGALPADLGDGRVLHSIPLDLTCGSSIPSHCEVPGFPRYLNLLNDSIASQGFDIRDFTLFRAVCEYPPTGSSLMLDVGVQE